MTEAKNAAVKRAVVKQVAILSFVLLLGLITAFTPELSQKDIRAAVDSGNKMISPKHGYIVKDYVLFDVPDPLVITPDEGEVEAVIVGTPFERLQYSSYLTRYQGSDLTQAKAQQQARMLSNTVHFVAFAHAPSGEEKDRNFLAKFSKATLTTGGDTLSAASVDTFGPAKDFYTVQGKQTEFLWLGYVDYTFNLAPLAAQGVNLSQLQGTLKFSDSSGKAYSFKVDLSNYR